MTGPAFDPNDLGVAPRPGSYEAQLAAWGQAKVAHGADPDVVKAHVGTLIHQYRSNLGAQSSAEEPETTGERAAGALSAAYQGLTLGAGNKITAGIRTVLPQALGGTQGFDFPEALKEQTGVLDDYKNRHPGWAGAMEIAGGIPAVIATGGASEATGASRVAKAFQLMKQGAGYGAATGALSSNSLSDIPGNALTDAATGAVVGPIAGTVLPAVARGALGVARRVMPTSALLKAASDAIGGGAASSGEKAQQMVRNALESGGADLSTATAGIPADSPTSALELGSPQVQALARQARNVPTSNARGTIDQFLSQRQAGTGDRIERALEGTTGHVATDVQQPIEDLIAQRSAEAQPLYEKAEAYGEIQNPDTIKQINTLRQNPTFAAAWNRGQTLKALVDGPADSNVPNISPDRMAELKAQGLDKFLPASLTAPPPGPTVSDVNAWKKGLDATIESGYGSSNALSRSEARIYRQKLNDVLSMVDQEVPDFAAARQSFAGNSELKEAAEAGAQHFSPATSAQYLQRTLPDQLPTDGEQHAYQSNALNAFVQKVRNLAANPDLPTAQRGTNIVQRVMGDQGAGQKLRMLFPDEPSYTQFLGQMEQEAQYPQTNKFLTQQSSTAAQQAENSMSPGAMRDVAMSTVSRGAKMRLVARAFQALAGNGQMQPAVADAVASNVTKTGPALTDMLTKMMADKQTSVLARQRVSALLSNLTAAQTQLGTPSP